MKIIEVLGKNYKNIRLKDDETSGISYSKETLENFMKECEINENDEIGMLQRTLKECGVRQIEIADSIIEEMIQQKIWDIEQELNIDIMDYRWDYKEING